MEYMKLVAEDNKGSPKRDCRLSITKNQKAMKCNLLEAIAQVHGGSLVSTTNEDGVVRMKIVIRKHELKQVLAMMEGGKSTAKTHQASPSLSLEQRLHVMHRRQLRRSAEHVKGNRKNWCPALHSIPEEL